jgi:hypothetical protein
MGLQASNVELQGLVVMTGDSEIQGTSLSDGTRGTGGPISHVETDGCLELLGRERESLDNGRINKGLLSSRVN